VGEIEKNLREVYESLETNSTLKLLPSHGLVHHVESLRIGEVTGTLTDGILLEQVQLAIHVYRLSEEMVQVVVETEQDNLFGDSETVNTHSQLSLPARELDGLFDSLIYDDHLPVRLLHYVHCTMLFSDAHVDHHLVSWNRVILLHGPPGTGKTSLAKALAQKCSIRLMDKYPLGGKLVEINAHSLFSKWFSESGKLVMKLFAELEVLVGDEDCFVCILIDEVESLTAARKAALSGSEPSDSLRVVNALLTQIDRLKQHHNVLIITTSNITDAIDVAFVDRADIKAYVGNPSLSARYHVLRSSIRELQRCRLVENTEEEIAESTLGLVAKEEWLEGMAGLTLTPSPSQRLFTIAQRCEGLSGRALRKLPFLAYAANIGTVCTPLFEFLTALEKAIEQEHEAREMMGH
jgi:DNA polymerase III delta prime subunit